MSAWTMTLETGEGTSLGSELWRRLTRPSSVVSPTGGMGSLDVRPNATGSIDALLAGPTGHGAPGPAELIAEIRSALSLNISELAAALHVERPTIYSWISGTATPQPGNLRRLHETAGWAREWGRLCPMPVGPAVRQPGLGGESLVDVLSREQLSPASVRSHFAALLPIASQPSSVGVPPTRTLGLRARGVPLIEAADGSAEIDRITRRPIAPED